MHKEEYHIYLTWPKYLAQWYAHEMHRHAHFEDECEPEYQYDCDVPVLELEPVHTLRGSLQRSILEANLTKPSENFDERPPQDATICLVLPHFLNKPPRYYHCLRPSGQILLKESVRNSLRIQLASYIGKMMAGNARKPGTELILKNIILAFMELNGIKYTDTNYEAICKIWKRINDTRRMNEYRNRSKQSKV